MRDHSLHIELSRENAVATMLDKLDQSHWPNSPCMEKIALHEAFGRTLAHPIHSKTDVPNTLTCCMDSIAVHWADFENLPDGALPDTSSWTRGVDWEFANTGVAMPKGFDTAIVIEHVEVSDDEQRITINATPSERFAGTRAAGSQMHAGDLVIDAGTTITPDVAARIAGAGISSVTVKSKPRVAFIPTGNELVPPNLPLSHVAPEKYAGVGRVFESNSLVVQGKVEQWGGTYVPFDIVADDYDAIRSAVLEAVTVADIVILNAGSSKGSDDWSVEVLEEIGKIICHQTNHGPGHHSSLALVNETPIVGISGPSGGASFTLDFYLRPLMKRFLGQDPSPALIPARLKEPFPASKHGGPTSKPAGETRPREATKPGSKFHAIRFMMLEANEEGTLWATPVKGRPGSAQTQHANALYMLACGPDDAPPSAGDVIYVELR